MLGPILNTIPKGMKDLGDSYLVKPDLGGMTAYPPRPWPWSATIIEAEHKTYRETCFGHTRTRQRKGSIVLHKLMIVAIPFVFHRGHGSLTDLGIIYLSKTIYTNPCIVLYEPARTG